VAVEERLRGLRGLHKKLYEEKVKRDLPRLKECLDKITDLLGECDVLLTQLGAYKTREELRRAHETIEKIRGRVWEALQGIVKRLSELEKEILRFLLSREINSEVSVYGRFYPRYSREEIKKALERLEREGYIKREKVEYLGKKIPIISVNRAKIEKELLKRELIQK